MKRISLITLLLLFLTFSTGANAAVLNFDALNTDPSGVATLTNEYGFTWTNFGVMKPAPFNPAFIPAINSPSQIAFNQYALVSEIDFGQQEESINFQKAYFASPYDSPHNLSITGTFADGTSLTENVTIADGGWINFQNFNNITSISFDAEDTFFGMDDFTYEPTPAPEPASMALGLMGLAGLLGAKRRKKQIS